MAADMTITEERASAFRFSRPLLTDIDEVVVTGPGAPEIDTIRDLAGVEAFVRESSSCYEHLQRLAAELQELGLAAPIVIKADELLEAEDIFEMLEAGVVHVSVVDDYKAEFWSGVFPDVTVRRDLVVNEDGAIAWVTRTDTPELMDAVNRFLRKYGKGTLVGNDTYNRSLTDASRVRCAHRRQTSERALALAGLFRTCGEQYDFDWLMLAAQGFQESGFRQDRRSPAGAVGIMHIKPSTAADRNVGIADVSTEENNIHAATRYLRFLADRYFSDEGINELNQWLFSLAAYNAGPAKVASMRREAAGAGYDPDFWFDNVEIIAERYDLRQERHGDTLAECL